MLGYRLKDALDAGYFRSPACHRYQDALDNGNERNKKQREKNVHLTYCLTLQTLPTLIGVAPFAAAVVVGGAMPLIWGDKARPGSKMES